MSKLVKATCSIKEVDRYMLDKAIELYARHHNAEVIDLTDERVRVISNHPTNWMNAVIGMKDDQIEIQCDDMVLPHTRDIIEQYYMATDIAEEYDTEPEMNEQGELVLMLEVI